MSRHLLTPVLLSLAAGCASSPTAIDLPAGLKPGASESLALIVPAKGVQIYECRAKKDQADQYEWAFVAPEADLFDARGAKIGKHYAGPRWESNDGSTVLGSVKERADAPRPDAIPWLLLTSKSEGPSGSFSNVTSIQRLNTVGGVAPAAGCSQGNAGTVGRVSYTADYYFFTAQESEAGAPPATRDAAGSILPSPVRRVSRMSCASHRALVP